MDEVKSRVEIRQVVGEFKDKSGKTHRAGWDMDIVLFKGRQVATINRVPGAAIGLMSHAMLTTSEKAEIVAAIAEKRGGVPPANISEPVKMPFELLDDEADDE